MMDRESRKRRNERGARMLDLFLAVCLNAVILGALFLLMRPYFETNDDTALLTLVNGAKYSSDPHMVIASIFLGRILMLLYSITHKVPWYTLVQYAMLFVSFTGVTYVMIQRSGRLWGSVISAVVVLWMGYESYIVIQFSRTAGITAASAMLLMFYAVSPLVHRGSRSSDIHVGGAIAGILLILPACWLRFTQFLPSVVLTSGIGLWMLLHIWLPDRQERAERLDRAERMKQRAVQYDRGSRREDSYRQADRRSRSSRYDGADRAGLVGWGSGADLETIQEKWMRTLSLFIPFVMAAALCMGCRFVDKWSYENDEVWRNFHQFDLLREQLYDYGFPDYAANLDVYREAGISDAGYALYRNWSFTDPDRFDVSVMKKLIAAKEPRQFSKAVVKGFIEEVPIGLIQKPVSWFFLLLIVMFLAGGRLSRNKVLPILWEVILFGVLYLYLYYNGRYLRSRVDVPLLYSVCLCVLWQIRPDGVKRTWWTFLLAIGIQMAVPSLRDHYKFRITTASKPENEAKRRERFEQLSDDPDHLYVMKMGSMTAHQCYGPFDVMPEKVLGNVLYLGGWAAYSRSFMDTMEAYGISNPYRDLIGSDKLYLVDNDIELTITYLRENYDPNARYKRVKGQKKLGDYKVYRILSGS